LPLLRDHFCKTQDGLDPPGDQILLLLVLKSLILCPLTRQDHDSSPNNWQIALLFSSAGHVLGWDLSVRSICRQLTTFLFICESSKTYSSKVYLFKKFDTHFRAITGWSAAHFKLCPKVHEGGNRAEATGSFEEEKPKSAEVEINLNPIGSSAGFTEF
jgi:hypothetical protein